MTFAQSKKFHWLGKEFDAVKVELYSAKLLLIKGKKGFLGCGYLSVETAEKLGDALAIVRGVDSYEGMLKAKIVSVSAKAKELGVSEGMNGSEALEKFA
ncbi:MAG: DUF1805 domain-containing protein [Candidatus Diapherotrites archaeon]